MMSEGGMAVGEGLGHRSASPPGRESREDWRGGQGRKISPSPMARRSRSRSRSPRASSRERSFRYQKEGTNTISDDPLAQRARLFVGNIEPNRVHRRDLIRLFSRYGDVTGVSVHKGYAFVQMDRERSANKAINYEDNKMFMGSRIHVEFSQAALKAGAKFTVERAATYDSPPRVERAPPLPPPPPSHISESLALLEVEREREERLLRILQMERELSYLRSREEYEPVSRRSHYDSHYDRGETLNRGSPPLRDLHSHTRDELGIPRSEERRSLYNRPPSPGALPRGGSSSVGSFHDRETISYPTPNLSRTMARDGHLTQYGGYSNPRGLTSLAVGYGSGMSTKPTGGPPPGWPSSEHDKANMNRAPFANAGPWS